jgi:hypothetical protein
MAASPFEFTLKFASGPGSIDSAKGILLGVAVAEVGEATGHFAFLDKSGGVVGVGGIDDATEFPSAVRRLPLAMDEKSLNTVVASAKKRVRTREDHDDEIESRAGYAENFRIQDQKVICDLKIFDSYGNRAVFLEAAAETPELIGLSGDFKFITEIVGDRAMMRVTRVEAVDIVDEGALTHAGLFSVKKAGAVDIGGNAKADAELSTSMAKKDDEMPDFKAFKEQCAAVAAWKAKNSEGDAVISEALAAFAPPKEEPSTTEPVKPEEKASLKSELVTEMSALFATKLNEAIATAKTEGEKAAKAELVEFKKQMSALGMKTETPSVSSDAAAVAAKAKESEQPKDFLSLRASIATERKIKPAEAARVAMIEHPEIYRAYQVKLGILKA